MEQASMTDSTDGCRKLRPGDKFYLALSVWNLDGTLDLQAETPTADTDLDATLAAAVDVLGSDDDAVYIYECRAIKKVVRGKVRIIDIKAKS